RRDGSRVAVRSSPCSSLAFHGAQHRAAEACRGIGNGDASALHRLDLVAGAALAARDDGAGVTHAPARRRGHSGDEADDRLLDLVVAQEFGGILFRRAADLADHDDALGLLVGEIELEAVYEIGAVDGIAADADAGRLAEPGRGCLRHRLVGQGAGARDDADRARRVDVARHDADLALAGRDDAGTVGPDEARLSAAQ